MPLFIGFSTQNVNQPKELTRPGSFGGIGNLTTQPRLGKKYRLTDENLVLRDFINALSIKQGDKVGQPQYGTTLWTYVFEPNTSDVVQQIEDEVRRVASLDPRIIMNSIGVYSRDNGIMLQMEMAFTPFNNVVQAAILLDKYSGTITTLAQ
jgi:phage baseplate assembly protein W